MNGRGIISLSGIGFAYTPDRPDVLKNLSLEIPEGSRTAILGPNGGGKTTLLHVFLGLLPPREGVLRVAGKPPAAYARRELSRIIGLVPQNEHIPFDFSLLDYVLLGRAPYLGALEQPGKEDEEAARAALDTVGLAVHERHPVTALSGGERQLAMIARALAQAPRILLLDEPTSHLDLGNRQAVQQVLRKMAAAGVTVAAGHTNATYDVLTRALEAGVTGFTHLFNAMSPLTSREPGAVGAALESQEAWCGIIADGRHIHPAVLRIAFAAKRRDRFMLVTDAMPSVGMADKRFTIQGRPIRVVDGVCVDENGTLAGSDLDMAGAVANAVRMAGLPLEEAARMASAYPAAFLGLGEGYGRIAVGARADLVLLDAGLKAVRTWIGGSDIASHSQI